MRRYVSVTQAKTELGEEGFFSFVRWLRDRGYSNLTQTEEGSYKHEVFATQDQLREFVSEQVRDFKGSNTLDALWGQSREILGKPQRKVKKGK